jgi:hypothetical protein
MHKEYLDCKINLFLNDILIKADLSENNLKVDINIKQGENKLEIKVEEKSRSLNFKDFFGLDKLRSFEPKLYSLYFLKVS